MEPKKKFPMLRITCWLIASLMFVWAGYYANQVVVHECEMEWAEAPIGLTAFVGWLTCCLGVWAIAAMWAEE